MHFNFLLTLFKIQQNLYGVTYLHKSNNKKLQQIINTDKVITIIRYISFNLEIDIILFIL